LEEVVGDSAAADEVGVEPVEQGDVSATAGELGEDAASVEKKREEEAALVEEQLRVDGQAE